MLGNESSIIDQSIFKYQRVKKKYVDRLVDTHDERVQNLYRLLGRLIGANEMDRDKSRKWEVMVLDVEYQEAVEAVRGGEYIKSITSAINFADI